MTNENSSTFNDNSNFIEFQNLLNIMRDFLKSDTQQELPELQFQEVKLLVKLQTLFPKFGINWLDYLE